MRRLTTLQQAYVEGVGPAIATAFEIVQSRQAIEAQQSKLQKVNDELVEQTESLQY